MSECKTCGRFDGHWIGCEESQFWAKAAELMDAEKEITGIKNPVCSFGDCEELRRSDDKRVKFCEFHSNPKNRK